jgi:hypothetical protein
LYLVHLSDHTGQFISLASSNPRWILAKQESRMVGFMYQGTLEVRNSRKKRNCTL